MPKISTFACQKYIIVQIRDRGFYRDFKVRESVLTLDFETLYAANAIRHATIACTDCCTHVKISHLVASLPTSRQQVVFALLVACSNLVDIIRLVARLFQLTSPIQS